MILCLFSFPLPCVCGGGGGGGRFVGAPEHQELRSPAKLPKQEKGEGGRIGRSAWGACPFCAWTCIARWCSIGGCWGCRASPCTELHDIRPLPPAEPASPAASMLPVPFGTTNAPPPPLPPPVSTTEPQRTTHVRCTANRVPQPGAIVEKRDGSVFLFTEDGRK